MAHNDSRRSPAKSEMGGFAETGDRCATPILVTGTPRAGTTWVARMLEQSGQVAYINEPLNPRPRPGRSPALLAAPVRHRFQYICEENEHEYVQAYRDLLRFRYRPLSDLRLHHAPSDVRLIAQLSAHFLRARLERRRALVADPYAVLSSEWLARRLGFRVVAVVRDPAAVVSSRKRLGWRIDLRQLLDQPLLVRDRLERYRADLEAMVDRRDDLVGQGSLLWRVVYDSLDQQRALSPEMIVVRHEDLSVDPLEGFRRLYRELGLDFSAHAARAIGRASGATNPSELDVRRPHTVQLDSRANLDNWRRRLEPAEVARIRALTSDVAERYYPDAARANGAGPP